MTYRIALVLCLYPIVLMAGVGSSTMRKDDGVLVQAWLYRNSDGKEISHDQDSYFPTTPNCFVCSEKSTQEQAAMAKAAHAENRITLQLPIIDAETKKVQVYYMVRFGKGQMPDHRLKEVTIGKSETEPFDAQGYYAILSATIIAANKRNTQ